MENFNQEEFNEFVVKNNVIGFFENPIKLKSGRISNWYVNWRINDVFLIEKLSDFVIKFTQDLGLNPDCFFGVPEGATKLGIITQHKWAKQSPNYGQESHILPMGRGKPKEHGDIKDRYFVGEPKGKIILLEDVTTTGGSLLTTIDSLQQAGFSIMAAFGLTNRMEIREDGKSVKQVIEAKGVPYYSLSNAIQLLPKAYKKLNPGEEIGRAIESEFEKYGVEKIKLKKSNNVLDKLLEKIDEKQNPCVVGLDPVLERIPKHLIKGDSFEDVAEAFRKFSFAIIDAVYDLVPAIKPQIAFYEKYGHAGVKAFKDTVDYAHAKGLIVIEDGKRNDIGNTAQAYADGHLGIVKTELSNKPSFDLDFLTVNPYLGSDGIKPFFEVCKEHGKGIFILVKTSNPGSGEFQDRFVEITEKEKFELENLGIQTKEHKTPLYNLVALQVNKFAQECKGKRGYASIGAVVGATYPIQAENLRKLMPNSFFLVPGYGAQGGGAEGVVPCFNKDGYGAVINSARGIIFAYEKYKNPKIFAEAAREATIQMIEDINSALKNSGKFPEKWKRNIEYNNL